MSEHKAPAPSAPEPTISPAAEGHGVPADRAPTKGAAIKAKVAALKDKFKAIPFKKPSLSGVNFKEVLSAVGAGLASLPRAVWSGDWLLRIAALGFISSLALFIVTAPQALLVLKNTLHNPQASVPQAVAAKHTPQDAHGAQVSEKKPHAVSAPLQAQGLDVPVERLSAVVFLGQFRAKGPLEIEAFAECLNDDTAERLRERLAEAQKQVKALLEDRSGRALASPEAQAGLRRQMKSVLNEVLGGGIKEVHFTRFEQ